MVYMSPAAMTDLARNDPEKFINLCKKNDIKDIRFYKGYEATNDKVVMLNTGRQISSTVNWNPLTFALVNNSKPLLKYIFENHSHHLSDLLSIEEDQICEPPVNDVFNSGSNQISHSYQPIKDKASSDYGGLFLLLSVTPFMYNRHRPDTYTPD